MAKKKTKAWFDKPDPDTGEVGLRFSCTMCGNCCSGPTGVVMFTPDEGKAIAKRLGIGYRAFLKKYAFETSQGFSLKEVKSPANGLDCIFLDRETIPGRAICGIYEDRPKQCTTWPFWPEMLRSRDDWVRAKKDCPGLDSGRLYAPEDIRIIRDHEANG